MEIIYLPHYNSTPLFATEGDAGIDLRASFKDCDSVKLAPNEDIVIPTGIKLHIGSEDSGLEGYGLWGMIAPRSGLGFKHYVRLANTIAVIDSGFTSEIMIKLRNEGLIPLTIEKGDRICQLIFTPHKKDVTLTPVKEFTTKTARGEKGFGHSGVK